MAKLGKKKSALQKLRGSVLRYERATDPVIGIDEFEVLKIEEDLSNESNETKKDEDPSSSRPIGPEDFE